MSILVWTNVDTTFLVHRCSLSVTSSTSCFTARWPLRGCHHCFVCLQMDKHDLTGSHHDPSIPWHAESISSEFRINVSCWSFWRPRNFQTRARCCVDSVTLSTYPLLHLLEVEPRSPRLVRPGSSSCALSAFVVALPVLVHVSLHLIHVYIHLLHTPAG